jgi:hypothetical protein
MHRNYTAASGREGDVAYLISKCDVAKGRSATLTFILGVVGNLVKKLGCAVQVLLVVIRVQVSLIHQAATKWSSTTTSCQRTTSYVSYCCLLVYKLTI